MLEVVKPQIINEIEFYVSNDGKVCGVSQNGLARLCGVASKTMSTLVISLESPQGKNTSNLLEPLHGKVLSRELQGQQSGGVQGAKIVNSKAAARIIRYYAYESKAANDTAKFSYDKFAEIGVDAWILEQTGYRSTQTEIPVDFSNLSLMKAASAALTRHIQQQENLQFKPGLKGIVEDISTNDYQALPPAKITLKDYLTKKGISLEKGQLINLSQIVSGLYKAHNDKYPEKIYQTYDKTETKPKAYQKVYGYSVDDYSIIDASIEFMKLN